MDEDHLIAAARYLALNPVRARLVARGQDWLRSSVRAHLQGEDDGLIRAGPVLDRVACFADHRNRVIVSSRAPFTMTRRTKNKTCTFAGIGAMIRS